MLILAVLVVSVGSGFALQNQKKENFLKKLFASIASNDDDASLVYTPAVKDSILDKNESEYQKIAFSKISTNFNKNAQFCDLVANLLQKNSKNLNPQK
jgi:hypothetical protein